MSELLHELLTNAGPLVGVLAIAAILIDRQIAKQRSKISEVAGSENVDGRAQEYDALEHAHQFYALNEASYRRNFFKLCERVFLIVLFPIVIFALNGFFDRDEKTSGASFIDVSGLDVVVAFTVILAAALSVWQTGVFLKVALMCKRKIHVFALLLGDLFLSIKIGTFVLATVTSGWLVGLAWSQGLLENERMQTSVFFVEGEALSNSSVAVFGFSGIPNISIQSSNEIDREKVLSLFLGTANAQILNESPVTDMFERSNINGINLSEFESFKVSLAQILLPEEPLRPNILQTFSSAWSHYDNIEDMFIPLLSGERATTNVQNLLGIANTKRVIDYACVESETGEYIVKEGFDDPRCGSTLGLTATILYPIDWASSRYAQDFLNTKVALSMLMFPPLIASALSIWMIISGALGNIVSRNFSRRSLLLKYLSENCALSIVLFVTIPAAIWQVFWI